MSTRNRDIRYHEFDPSDVQSDFMSSTEKQALVYGGFGGGKTRTMCEKIYKVNMKYPGSRALICRSNFTDVKGSTIQQCLLEDVIPDRHIPDGARGHNKSEHVIRHLTGEYGPNGEPIMSEIHYHGLGSSGSGSNDGLPRKVSGMQFNIIGIDEATETTEAQYVQLIGRLRYDGKTVADKKYKIPFRQIVAATNPAGPSHYLYRKFFDNEAGERYHLRPEDNPGVPDDYVQQLKDNYSGVFYERYVEGNWVGTDDVIYDEFDRRVHVRSPEFFLSLETGEDVGEWRESPVFSGMYVPPDNWEVFRSIDFGYPSPMCVHWWARPPGGWTEDGLGPLVLFREFYESETLVEDVADSIRKWSKDLDVSQTFADPAQAQDRETLSRHGVSSTEALKDVWNGIQEVKSELAREYGDDVPGIIFLKGARINPEDEKLSENNKPTSTVDEVGSYEWKDSVDEPVKRDDHGMDTMRYCVYTLAQRGTGPSREEMEDWEQMFNGGF